MAPQWDAGGVKPRPDPEPAVGHALLLHPQQQARLENRRPACTVGSLQPYARMETLINALTVKTADDGMW
ncbi:MAG: hypothetical protein H6973_17390 [Gammaproteobacteria bacterium]|nr:hypothetical protein [Gammaproteobacteria bacterium]